MRTHKIAYIAYNWMAYNRMDYNRTYSNRLHNYTSTKMDP